MVYEWMKDAGRVQDPHQSSRNILSDGSKFCFWLPSEKKKEAELCKVTTVSDFGGFSLQPGGLGLDLNQSQSLDQS